MTPQVVNREAIRAWIIAQAIDAGCNENQANTVCSVVLSIWEDGEDELHSALDIALQGVLTP